MRPVWWMALCLSLLPWPSETMGEDLKIGGQLHRSYESLRALLPQDTHHLLNPASIELFLEKLEGVPPDWAGLYGLGHHDPGHDDRLFTLNRERDARREGNQVLSWLITFVWSGELSSYNSDVGGFPVALGPVFVATRWGMVRFKPEEAPGNLVLVTDAHERQRLQHEIGQGHRLEVEVVMTGRLIPEESLLYDFSHEEEGRGLIMPVVRVESVHFLSVDR